MSHSVRIGIIGDYNATFRPHLATQTAIDHAAKHLNLIATIEWLPTLQLVHNPNNTLHEFDAL